MTAEAPQPIELRDRIIELRRVKRGEILPNPKNPRRHPEPQREAMRSMLATVGIAGAALAYKSERAGGRLVYIDGHLRDEEVEANLPVLLLDLNDEEADLLLAGYDHLSVMAESDDAQLAKLLSEIAERDKDSLLATGYDDDALKALLQGLAKGSREGFDFLERIDEGRDSNSGSQNPVAQAERFPLSVVLNASQLHAWVNYKISVNQHNDTSAFLELLSGVTHA